MREENAAFIFCLNLNEFYASSQKLGFMQINSLFVPNRNHIFFLMRPIVFKIFIRTSFKCPQHASLFLSTCWIMTALHNLLSSCLRFTRSVSLESPLPQQQ